MSFATPKLKARIDAVKARYESFSRGTPAPISFRQKDESEYDYEARYFSARMGVITNLIRTLKCSADQISICFAVSQAMFFYQDEIANNPELWSEEQRDNEMYLYNSFKMAMEDNDDIRDKLAAEAELLSATKGANRGKETVVHNLLMDHKILVDRLREYSGVMAKLAVREEGGLSLYDVDQKPKLGAIFTPEDYLKGLHSRSVQNASLGLEFNAAIAECCLLSTDFARVNDMGDETVLLDTKILKAVMERFEVLEEARANRYGFTQIRFG